TVATPRRTDGEVRSPPFSSHPTQGERLTEQLRATVPGRGFSLARRSTDSRDPPPRLVGGPDGGYVCRMTNVVIWTDGSSTGKSLGPGGYAAIVIRDGQEQVLSGGD